MKNPAVLPSMLACVALALFATSTVHAQWAGGTSTGADVIVGDITGVANYSDTGGIDAFSVGTTSCNIGDTPLDWIDGTNLHPVIGQNAYRLRGNRFEQIGQSWLKHGFLALNGGLCDTCITSPSTSLGVGCSDPYGASLNGSQGGLGPKFEVNAATGFYPWPYTGDGLTGNSIYKRLQIVDTDLDSTMNSGASYYIEAQYVAQDDSADGNSANSVSWRPANFSGSGSSYSLSLTGSTVRGEPAINAWKVANPSVEIKSFDIPNDGRFNVGLLITDNGNGTFTYEYAIHNQTSDRSAWKFEVPTAAGATITNIDFHDVAYHSGEPYSGADWTSSVSGGTVTWSTSDYATNTNANAIRWGTLYNFRFTTDTLAGDATLHLFKPVVMAGDPLTVNVSFAPDAFVYSFPNGLPSTLSETGTTTALVRATPLGGASDPATALLFLSVNGAPFSSQPLTHLGGTDYEATFPATPCGVTVDWYVSIEPVGSDTPLTSPAGAPADVYRSVSDAAPITFFVDDCETDTGFIVQGNATDGQWDRGVPVMTVPFRGDPPADSDGSGQCWLTDNVDGNSDVDGGTTILVSPQYDFWELPEGIISFDLWYNNSVGTVDDSMQIDISNGSGWVQVEDLATDTNGWENRSIRVADYVTPNSTVRFRLVVSDTGSGSIVEAGLDNIRLQTCPLLNENLAQGTVGVGAMTGPEQVLQINGSNGGPLRRVAVGFGQPLTFEMQQPTTNVFSSLFIVWGRVFRPLPGESYDIGGGVGTMCFTPCDADPFNANLFLFTDNSGFSTCPGLIGSTGTPWQQPLPAGVSFNVDITLQGIVIDPSAPLNLGITNAVNLRVDAGL